MPSAAVTSSAVCAPPGARAPVYVTDAIRAFCSSRSSFAMSIGVVSHAFPGSTLPSRVVILISTSGGGFAASSAARFALTASNTSARAER